MTPLLHAQPMPLAFGLERGEVGWLGPEGGEISAIAVDNNMVFVGTRSRRIYQLIEGSDSWRHIGTVKSSAAVYSIISLVVKGDTILAGANDGIWRSVDLGESWSEANSGIEGSEIPIAYRLLSDGKAFYAQIRSDAYRSTNGGTDWSRLSLGDNSGYFLSLAASGSALYEVGAQGIYRSTNAGRTWKVVKKGSGDKGFISVMAEGSTIYATNVINQIFRSTDDGALWKQADNGMVRVGAELEILYVRKGLVIAATRDRNGGNTQGYRSTDNGMSWSLIGAMEGYGVRGVASLGEVLYAATDGGVYRSIDNGITWIAFNMGLVDLDVRALAKMGDDLLVAAPYLHRSSDQGKSWRSINGTLEGEITQNALAVHGTTILAATNDYDRPGIRASTDNGASWNYVPIGPTFNYIGVMLADGNTIYAAHDSLYRSDDGGSTWIEIGRGDLGETAVGALCVDGEKLYAATTFIHRSTDRGNSWQTYTQSDAASIIKLLAAGGPTILAVTDQGMLLRSTDAGMTWTQGWFDGIAADATIRALLFHDGTFIVGTEYGAFVSSDNGSTWDQEVLTAHLNVSTLLMDRSMLYIGTEGAGVFVLNLTSP